MQDIQYIKHNYSENREVRVFCNYIFYQLFYGQQETTSDEIDNEILATHSDKLSSLFHEHILKSLKEGETSGTHEITETLTISSGDIEVIIELDWEVNEENILSQLTNDKIENFEYQEDVEVEIELSIELLDESEEAENEVDFSGVVDYITSDIESEVEDGETDGSFGNLGYNGLSYNVEWKLI